MDLKYGKVQGSGKMIGSFFLSIFYWLCYYSFPNFFHFIHPLPCNPNPPASPPYFMSMGCTYMFFDFSVSYIILNLYPSILCLPIMLLIPCTFPIILPLLLTTENPPCDVQFSDSVPVLVVCLVFVFLFVFWGSVVDSCDFVVILLFIVLIFFYFLDKSL